MALALYSLPPEYADLVETELEESEDRSLDARLDELEAEVTTKALSLAKVVRTLEGEADLLEAHSRSLVARAGARRQRADYLKRWLQREMQNAGIEKAKDPFVTVWLQLSPGSIEVLDEAAVPPEFKRVNLRLPLSLVPPSLMGLVQTCDVDRALIQALLKQTGELPAGIAYRHGDKHLRIR